MKHSQKQPVTAGVLVLDTHFPRVWGDVGCAQTFVTPPFFEVVDGASVARIVSGKPIDEKLVQTFVQLAQKLEHDGADFITTSCGFLSTIQAQLADAVSVPVISSSLLLLEALGSHNEVAVLTFDADELNQRHLYGEHGNVSLHGIPKQHDLKRMVQSDLQAVDVDKVAKQTATWVHETIDNSPQNRVIVIECTNLVPYRALIEQASQRPVYDLFDAIGLVTSVDRAMLVREPFMPMSVPGPAM